MPKYHVLGTVKIGVTVTVEAENKDAAVEKVYEEWGGLDRYVGNGCGGNCDKLIGTRDKNISLDTELDADFDYESATLADDEESNDDAD